MGTALLQRDGSRGDWGVYPRHRIKYGAGSNPLQSRERGSFVRLRTNGGGRDGPDFGPQQGPALLRRRDCHATLAMTGENSHPHPSPLPSRERGLVRHATLAMTGGFTLATVSSTGQAPTLSNQGRGGPSTGSGRTEVGGMDRILGRSRDRHCYGDEIATLRSQ